MLGPDPRGPAGDRVSRVSARRPVGRATDRKAQRASAAARDRRNARGGRRHQRVAGSRVTSRASTRTERHSSSDQPTGTSHSNVVTAWSRTSDVVSAWSPSILLSPFGPLLQALHTRLRRVLRVVCVVGLPGGRVPPPDGGGLALESQHGDGGRGEPEPSPGLGRKFHPAGREHAQHVTVREEGHVAR